MALIICSECGKEYSNKAKACPNCGAPTESQNDKDFAVLPDEYYLKYAKSITPLSSNDYKTVLNAIRDIYKDVDKKTVIKNPVNISNHKDFFNFTKAILYCITMFANAKDEGIVPLYNLLLFFVKYHTRLILLYGDEVEKAYLSRCIYLLQGVKSLNDKIVCDRCLKEIPIGLEYCPFCGEQIRVNNNNKKTDTQNLSYNKYAIWGFVISLLSILLNILSFISLAFTIKALDEIDSDKEKGKGLAIAGFVISIIYILSILLRYFNSLIY